MTKARRQEKNELIKCVKDISMRMEAFSDSVQALQDLKEELEQVDEELAERERTNKFKLEQLNKDYEDNKIRLVNKGAQELGKELITKEELNELKDSLNKLKVNSAAEINAHKLNLKADYDEKLSQALNVQKLQFDAETAQLKAEVEMHKKECENLKETLQRMSDELSSQKKLTGEIAGIGRRETPTVQKVA